MVSSYTWKKGWLHWIGVHFKLVERKP